ncbi:MAG: FecR family protein [Polyangiaceae bacterium]
MKRPNMDRDTAEANVIELASLARNVLTGANDDQLVQGERAIRRRLSDAKRPRTPMALRVAAIGLLCSTVLAVGLYWQRSTERSLLSYRIENGSIGADQTIVANGAQSPRMRFSDGTEIKLQPNTTARVRYLSDRGAALALEAGQLHAEIVHSSHSEWRFDAGPYVIQVTGTVFDVSWEPDPDRFELKLQHGSVTVHAPISNGPIPVRAGQWLTIRSRSNEITIRDLTTLNPSAPHGAPVASLNEDPDLAPTTTAGPFVAPTTLPSHEPVASESWIKALRLGHLD